MVGGAESVVLVRVPDRLAPAATYSLPKISFFCAESWLKLDRLGTTVGQRAPIVESSSRPLSLAACRDTLNFLANSFSPQPYVARLGFEPPLAGVKYAISTPPPPWSATSLSSSRISVSSR